MSGGHTPGPWRSVKGTTTGRAVVALGQPKVRFNVASVGGPNRDANAMLISVAPELLDALITAADAIHEHAPGLEYLAEGWDALIAKATGA